MFIDSKRHVILFAEYRWTHLKGSLALLHSVCKHSRVFSYILSSYYRRNLDPSGHLDPIVRPYINLTATLYLSKFISIQATDPVGIANLYHVPFTTYEGGMFVLSSLSFTCSGEVAGIPRCSRAVFYLRSRQTNHILYLCTD